MLSLLAPDFPNTLSQYPTTYCRNKLAFFNGTPWAVRSVAEQRGRVTKTTSSNMSATESKGSIRGCRTFSLRMGQTHVEGCPGKDPRREMTSTDVMIAH